MKKTSIIIVSLSAILLTGCISYRPISSKPPESAIVLKSPFKVTISLLGDHITFPVGEYRPLYEDKNGYYFQSPAKVIVVSLGIGTEADDAGLFVERGSKDPTKWYLIEGGSNERTGSLKTGLSYELIP
jgi:hypothetical protein